MTYVRGLTVKELRDRLKGLPADAAVVFSNGELDYWHVGTVRGPLDGIYSVALEPGAYCAPECPRCTKGER